MTATTDPSHNATGEIRTIVISRSALATGDHLAKTITAATRARVARVARANRVEMVSTLMIQLLPARSAGEVLTKRLVIR